MKAFARIGMLVKRGAVEARKPVRVGREMAGTQSSNDPNARPHGAIDEAAKSSGDPSARRCE